MPQEHKPGQFRDAAGDWRKERRSGRDRRADEAQREGKERRIGGRRKSDLIDIDREHRDMINEALDDFAAGEDNDA